MDEALAEARREVREALEEWREALPRKRYRSWLRTVTRGLKSTIADLSIEECREVVKLVSGAEEDALDWIKAAEARAECRRGHPSKEAQALCVQAFYANPVRYLELTEAGARSVRAKRSSTKAAKMRAARRAQKRREWDQRSNAVRAACPELFVPLGKPKPKGRRLLCDLGLLDQIAKLRGREVEPVPEVRVTPHGNPYPPAD